MDPPFARVAAGAPIEEAFEALLGGEPALMIVEGDLPVGVITRSDLLEFVARRGVVLPQARDGAITGNNHQPSGQGTSRNVKALGVAPELVENILQDLLGSLSIAKNPVQYRREHARIAIVQLR